MHEHGYGVGHDLQFRDPKGNVLIAAGKVALISEDIETLQRPRSAPVPFFVSPRSRLLPKTRRRMVGAMTETELASLGADGWFIRDGFAGAQAAADAAQAYVDASSLTPASISRQHSANQAVRGDSSQWLTTEHTAFADLSAMFEALRCEVNRDAWLGLTRFDLQLAHFPGDGSAYVRHRDAFAGAPGRRLTAIAYLNAGWTAADGGALRLHVATPIDLAPILGRLVVFMSEKVEHEVLPTWASRMAVTAWYYGP